MLDNCSVGDWHFNYPTSFMPTMLIVVHDSIGTIIMNSGLFIPVVHTHIHTLKSLSTSLLFIHSVKVKVLSYHVVLDLRSITNELGSVIDKWFQIGVQLGVSESKLRQIEADYHTLDRRFSEMISFWLNGNTKVAVTWRSLVEVLDSCFVNEKGLANQLREKLGLKFDKAPLSTGNPSTLLEGGATKE